MLFRILKKALFRVPVLRFPAKRGRVRKARSLRRAIKGSDMNRGTMLHGVEPREILQTVINEEKATPDKHTD